LCPSSKKRSRPNNLLDKSGYIRTKKKYDSDGPTQLVGITPRALKLRDFCKYVVGVSDITMLRLIDRGFIKPNRSIRHLLIPITELDKFLEVK